MKPEYVTMFYNSLFTFILYPAFWGVFELYRRIINLKTYEAIIDGVLLDLTFMEYELLKFFIENQENVWSREELLEKVWGYDYFGGARTVDVHVRRLRSKLGEKRLDWIKTVHSVGYKFN